MGGWLFVDDEGGKEVNLIVTEYLNFSLLSNFIWLIVRVFFLCCIEKGGKKKFGIGSLAVAFIIYLKGLKKENFMLWTFFTLTLTPTLTFSYNIEGL